MSEQLREALRELGERAPEIDATEQAGARTWRRARRSRRISAAAALCALVALFAGGVLSTGLVDLQQSAPTVSQPYDPSKLAIPDKIWLPSPWTPRTDDAGPLGPLALIGIAPHRTSWFHVDNTAFFGVSAATGEYRFLDLPDRGNHVLALSPDGTKIAYFLAPAGGWSQKFPEAVGFAVYNSVTNRLVRHMIVGQHGITTDGIAWSRDSARLVVSFTRITVVNRGVGGTTPETTVWTAPAGGLIPVAPADGGGSHSAVPTAEASWWDDDHNRTTLTSVDTRTATRVVSRVTTQPGSGRLQAPLPPMFSSDGLSMAFVSPLILGGGATIAVTGAQASAGVFVAQPAAETGAGWVARRVPVQSHGRTGVLGWLDPGHLLVSNDKRTGMYSLDLADGALTRVISMSGDAREAWPNLAADLVGRPLATRHAPPSPRDPRVIPGICLGILGGGLVLWFWLHILGLAYRRNRA